ncbi:D-alanine--D-alanine ligase family protein [Parasphingorhabdus litoris]|uniref:phosphoribosylglycinamide synthetase n=1 Tax=Parasphingorhabdus litoris TaxID=394733 RepID=UPI001E590C2B|nr:phosphoribosylglycinamide synthetase [Parasphingorhabdus litoris]
MPRRASIPPDIRANIHVLLVAKHVFAGDGLHHEDGNHAIYHREIRAMLENMGVQLSLADSYEALFDDPECDFLFPLLNRGGFLNSEMLLPLLCTRLDVPFLGASPILRGLSDDKHLTKLEGKARGLPMAPWAIYRRGAPVLEADCPMTERMVVKPNASSASWGVRDASDWHGIAKAVADIHDEGHDAIVEPFLDGHDIEVPMMLSAGDPVLCPMFMNRQADPTRLRSYAEKRDLTDQGGDYEMILFDDPEWTSRIGQLTRQMAQVFHPFDYGRFEFRINPETGEMIFLETNLNCNLWSQKTFGWVSRQMGWTHAELVETILIESMWRQGVLPDRTTLAA